MVIKLYSYECLEQYKHNNTVVSYKFMNCTTCISFGINEQRPKHKMFNYKTGMLEIFEENSR